MTERSFEALANPNKTRRDPSTITDALDEAESSDQQKFRQQGMRELQKKGGRIESVRPMRRPPVPPPDEMSSSSSSNVVMKLKKDKGKQLVSSTTSSSSSSSIPRPQSFQPRPVMEENPIEREMEKAIRKAKLLARIDQLEERGIKPSKTFTWKSAEDEMVIEVAKMEVKAQRGARIKQGRAAFITVIAGTEKGMNVADERQMLPWMWYMEGITKNVVADIRLFDDCLERGVESILGPTGELPWYVELMSILIPMMVEKSVLNRFKNDPKHTNEVLKQNPELRQNVAREIVREEMAQRQQAPAAQPIPALQQQAGPRDLRAVPQPIATDEQRKQIMEARMRQLEAQRMQLQQQPQQMAPDPVPQQPQPITFQRPGPGPRRTMAPPAPAAAGSDDDSIVIE